MPAKAGAELLVEEWNKKDGIGGVPVKLFFIDEGAGTQALLAEYRRLVQEEKVDAMFASISSGNCQAIAPLAEDLKILNHMWDCGTQRILEEGKFRYVYRPQSYGTPEMLSTVLYLLRKKPDLKTIAVINQDYAWGRDSWQLFSTALKALKPDVRVVAELFPKTRRSGLLHRNLAPAGAAARGRAVHVLGWRPRHPRAPGEPARIDETIVVCAAAG